MTEISTNYVPRDYSLTGPEGLHAINVGLASAEWYHSDVPRKTMKELMQRQDGPAIRDTIIWLGLMIATAAGGIAFWGSWWALPSLLVYGVLYGSACDSRWHECGHGTAFRTTWMNNVVYHIASFMVMRNPVSWRWSHARHHTDTIIVGRDPEIAIMRPAALLLGVLRFVSIPAIFLDFRILARNAFGIITADEKNYLPDNDIPKAILWARLHMAVYAFAVGLALIYGTILPLVLIGGPRIYGAWHMVLTGLLQHGALDEDVLDHRLNSRSVYMNPVSRWIYWNMNYHIEHHMFPMVPFHALPKLHALIKHDLPPANRSIVDGYREMIAALWRQRSDPTYRLRRQLPDTARPYREEFHDVEVLREKQQA